VSAKRAILYGVVGAVVVLVLLGGGYYLYGPAGKLEVSAKKTHEAQTTASDDEPTPPTDAQNEKVMQLVAKARQLAGDSKFDEADAALQQADKVVPNSPEVQQGRRDVAALRTPEGQLANQLTKAQFAIDHGDYSAADKALAEAERLNAQAPQIAALRQDMEKARARDTRRGNRIAEHLTAMREAIARGNFARADSELDAAERIDIQDPDVRKAHIELNRARNSAEKKKDDDK